MAVKRGLGKGLGSLIPDNYNKKSAEPEPSSTEKPVKKVETVENKKEIPDSGIKDAQFVKITKVERNKEQPRRQFEEAALQELADSIKQYGILQPLLVKPVKDRFMIIAGERRWRAAKLAGLKEVPVIVRDYSDQEIMEISLIENIQREDLNVIEEAMAYQKLLDEFGYRQEDLAQKLSRSRTAITNRLRLLKLSAGVQNMLRDGSLSEGHARALLPLLDPEAQQNAAELVAEHHLSVRETEKLVKKLLAPPKQKISVDWKSADQFIYDKLEEDLRLSMGTKVEIRRQEKDKGKIIIDYYSGEELERIMDLLKK